MQLERGCVLLAFCLRQSQVMVSEPSSLVTSPTPKAVHIEPRTEPELVRRLSTGDVTTPH